MALCTISGTFIDQGEVALPGMRVSVYVPPTPVTAIGARERTYTSDEDGLVEFAVVQGIRIRVTIIQRGLSREFTVPSEGAADLFTLLADAPDPFSAVAT